MACHKYLKVDLKSKQKIILLTHQEEYFKTKNNQISGSVQYKVQFCVVQRSDNESFDGREAAEETEGRSLSPLVKTRGGREDPKKQLT